MEVLIRTGARSKPRVVGDVEQPARSRRALGHVIRKNDLVADERACRRRSGDGEKPRAGTCAEAAAHTGKLYDAEAFHEVLERKVLTKGNEMHLVVARDDAAPIVDCEQTVIDACLAKRAFCIALFGEPGRAYDERRSFGQRRSDRFESVGRVGEKERNGCLWPNHDIDTGKPVAARLGEVEIVCKDLGTVLWPPLVCLIDIGLHDTKSDEDA